MTGAVLLLVLGLPAVDHEWRQNDRGEVECIIYLEPVLLKSLLDGDISEIDAGLPPTGEGRVHYRIVVGEIDESTAGVVNKRLRPNQDNFSARGTLGDAARNRPPPEIRAGTREGSRFSERAPDYRGYGDSGARTADSRAADGGAGRYGGTGAAAPPPTTNAQPRTVSEWIQPELKTLPLRFDPVDRGEGMGIDGPLSAPVIRVGRQDEAPPLLELLPNVVQPRDPVVDSRAPTTAPRGGVIGSQTQLEPTRRFGQLPDSNRTRPEPSGAVGGYRSGIGDGARGAADLIGRTAREDLAARQAAEQQAEVQRQLELLASQQREFARQQEAFNRQRDAELQRLRNEQLLASTNAPNSSTGGSVKDAAASFPFSRGAAGGGAAGSRFSTGNRQEPPTTRPGAFPLDGGGVEPATHTVAGDESGKQQEGSTGDVKDADEEKPWGLLGAVCAILAASLTGNVYLGVMAWGVYNRYQDMVDDMRDRRRGRERSRDYDEDEDRETERARERRSRREREEEDYLSRRRSSR